MAAEAPEQVEPFDGYRPRYALDLLVSIPLPRQTATPEELAPDIREDFEGRWAVMRVEFAKLVEKVFGGGCRVIGLATGLAAYCEPQTDLIVEGDWEELRGLSREAWDVKLREMLAGPAVTAATPAPADPDVAIILKALDRHG